MPGRSTPSCYSNRHTPVKAVTITNLSTGLVTTWFLHASYQLQVIFVTKARLAVAYHSRGTPCYIALKLGHKEKD